MKKFLLLITITFTTLFASVDNQDFRFVIVGDRHSGAVDNIFEEIIDEVSLFDPDFVINVGDMIEGYSEDSTTILNQWDTILAIVGRLPCKFCFVPGNHDLQNENDRLIFKRKTGFNRYYSFDYRNSHFIVLDNTMTYWAIPQDMDKEQLDWFKKDLEKNKNKDNIFVFYHIPTYLYALRDGTQDSLVATFEKYNVSAVFTGHHHQYSYLNQNNIEYINVGSSGGIMDTDDFARGHFYQYLFVSVRGTKYDIAVIKKGNTFLRNVVTAEDINLIERADREAVDIPACIVRDESKKTSQTINLAINNFGVDSIVQTLFWRFDANRYLIAPTETLLKIASEEKKELKFDFTIMNGSDIFPLPQFSLAFPFTYGKTCTIRNAPSIKRFANVKKVEAPLVIDGKLDEVTWTKIKPITNLGNYDGSSVAPIEKTEIYLCHDEENLYIGALCYESDFSKLVCLATEHDGATYTDDNIWFFLDSDYDQETYYQAIINSQGVVFDRLCRLKDGVSTKDLSWSGPWEVKPGLETDAWTLEIRIPKKDLEPYDKNQWGFNFRRLQNRFNDAGYWSIPFGHDPTYFGIIGLE